MNKIENLWQHYGFPTSMIGASFIIFLETPSYFTDPVLNISEIGFSIGIGLLALGIGLNEIRELRKKVSKYSSQRLDYLNQVEHLKPYKTIVENHEVETETVGFSLDGDRVEMEVQD